MRYIKPDYYENFACTADKCPDTCCAGWQIVIDEDSYRKYMDIGGDFGRRMQESLDPWEMSFRQCNGRCAFLNENNLCDLILEKGSEYLCETCARYPRHVEEFDGVREYSLSLSCPVAAELILKQKGLWQFLEEEDEQEEPLAEEFEDFDYAMFGVLEETRSVFWKILEQQMPLRERLLLLVDLASRFQELVDAGECLSGYELLEHYVNTLQDSPELLLMRAGDGLAGTYMECLLRQEGPDFHKALEQGLEMLWHLERLRPEWTEVLAQCRVNLLPCGGEGHDFLRKEFYASFNERELQELENYRENIIIFFIYTYFCGAVYDDMIFSKVALAVFSAVFWEETVMCRWFLADKILEKADFVRLAYAYAREVEHSDENLIGVEEWLMDKYEPVKEENKFETD
ncbi:MAG: flagellin lysine-N-methylase [Lachnospiraceae bacterium]|nr:flagellin lysine-N-methylase [Lachnospiraceae bacterium]